MEAAEGLLGLPFGSFLLQVRKRKPHVTLISNRAGGASLDAPSRALSCVPWGSCRTDMLGEGSGFSMIGALLCREVTRDCLPL